MGKAKIILAFLAIMIAFGSLFAFKARRFEICNVYTLLSGSRVTTIKVGDIIYATTIPNCTLTYRVTWDIGTFENVSSTTTYVNSTTAYTAVGRVPVVTTYPYCTLWVTRIRLCEE